MGFETRTPSRSETELDHSLVGKMPSFSIFRHVLFESFGVILCFGTSNMI